MSEINDLIQAKNLLSNQLLSGEAPIFHRMLSINSAAEAAQRNVHAVGVGRKISDGKVTNEMCVRLYVVQKLALSALSDSAVLPSEIDGIPTDIIESPPAFIMTGKKSIPKKPVKTGKLKSQALACTDQRRKKQRPLTAGISSGHYTITAGTIGYFCRSTKLGDNIDNIYALSNNHVFADVNKGQPGDALLQPGAADGGVSSDRFADLTRFVTIHMGGVAPNRVDAAIGRILPGNFSQPGICSIGRINSVGQAVEGLKVRKHGRTSGYTEGEVTDESYDAMVGMDHNNPNVVAKFVNQMRIDVTSPFTAFGLGGDSGSLIVGKSRLEAVGLYFAGPAGGTYGIANHIGSVLSELEIELL